MLRQAHKIHRRKSPTCGLFSGYDELFGKWVVDDAKYPKKRSMRSAGGNKHRLIDGDRPACVGKAVADEKMQDRVGFAGVDNAAPAGRGWGVEGRETTKQH